MSGSALQNPNAHLGGIWDRVDDYLCVLDLDGHLLETNQRARDLLGLAQTTRTGASFAEMLGVPADPQSRAGLQQALAAARAGQSSHFNGSFPTADGNQRQLDFSLQPLRDESGAIRHLLLRGQDASEFCLQFCQVQESDRRLRQFSRAVDQAPVSIVITDPQARILYVNPQFSEITGYQPEEVIGRRPSVLKAGDLPDALYQELWQTITSGKVWRGKLHNRKKGGELYWEEAVIAPLMGDDGQIINFVGIKQDITARRQAELDLAAERAKMTAVLESMPDFFFFKDQDGVFRACNRAFAEFLGMSEAELIGHTDFELVGPELAARFRADDALVLAAGQAKTIDELIPLPDGGAICLEMVKAPVISDDGQLLGLIGLGRNVSERKAVEDQLRQAASVFSSAHDGIMITDPQGVILNVNEAFTEMTGYRREEVIGRTPSLLKSGRHESGFFDAMWRSVRTEGYWRGEVWNKRKNGELFVEQLTISAVRADDGAITAFVSIFSDITVLKATQEELEHLAYYDALTHLPNRVLLSDRLHHDIARAKRHNCLLAICYIDLDGFKPVNDTYGHQAGDRLLVEVSGRLRDSLRADDTVSRLGGDEFVLLLSDLRDTQEAEHALNRLLATIAAPYTIGQHPISISASVGVTLYPLDASDADTLIRHADQAMYVAKMAGRNRYHLFDPEQDRRARSHRETLEEITRGLLRGEFVLYYQPKVDMRLGKVIGAEALVRWQHPEKGLLSPIRFLPQIEEHDLIVNLGEWVLQEAFRQQEVWQAQGMHLQIGVNISAKQLLSPNFSHYLTELLARHPSVRPESIELEILETAALEDIAHVSKVIGNARKMGIGFALDDFGTGYSSLTYFKQLPAATLKIDQSFVRDMLDDPEDLAIVEGILGLTRAFRRKVVAEGVETIEHGILLLHLGCDLAQGFGISHPMAAADLPAWIQAFQPDSSWTSSVMLRWHRDDFPLQAVEVDHRRWIDHLVSQARQGLGIEIGKDCRFGNWLNGVGRHRYSELEEFEKIEQIHSELHQEAEQLAAALARQDQPAVDHYCDSLPLICQQLQDQTRSLQVIVAMMARN